MEKKSLHPFCVCVCVSMRRRDFKTNMFKKNLRQAVNVAPPWPSVWVHLQATQTSGGGKARPSKQTEPRQRGAERRRRDAAQSPKNSAVGHIKSPVDLEERPCKQSCKPGAAPGPSAPLHSTPLRSAAEKERGETAKAFHLVRGPHASLIYGTEQRRKGAAS